MYILSNIVQLRSTAVSKPKSNLTSLMIIILEQLLSQYESIDDIYLKSGDSE